jgi:hypothetical protein
MNVNRRYIKDMFKNEGRWVLIDEKTGDRYEYTSLVWELAWIIVWFGGVLSGMLFSYILF